MQFHESSGNVTVLYQMRFDLSFDQLEKIVDEEIVAKNRQRESHSIINELLKAGVEPSPPLPALQRRTSTASDRQETEQT
jgi:hypothetical protein